MTGCGYGSMAPGRKIRCRPCANAAARRWRSKALGEAVRAAIASGASWQEVGRVLGVAEAAESEREVVEAFAETKRAVWGRFWGQS